MPKSVLDSYGSKLAKELARYPTDLRLHDGYKSVEVPLDLIERVIAALSSGPSHYRDPRGDANRLVSITVGGSTHTRTAGEWLALARSSLSHVATNCNRCGGLGYVQATDGLGGSHRYACTCVMPSASERTDQRIIKARQRMSDWRTDDSAAHYNILRDIEEILTAPPERGVTEK